jgi:hypothetical protein
MLYLAVRNAVFVELFTEPIGNLLIERKLLKLLVFDPKIEEIVRWID